MNSMEKKTIRDGFLVAASIVLAGTVYGTLVRKPKSHENSAMRVVNEVGTAVDHKTWKDLGHDASEVCPALLGVANEYCDVVEGHLHEPMFGMEAGERACFVVEHNGQGEGELRLYEHPLPSKSRKPRQCQF